MGTIICQTCTEIIASYEDEKVTVLYSKCDTCSCGAKSENL